MPTALVLDSITEVELEPTYQPTPAAFTRAPLQVVGHATPTPAALVHGRPVDPDEGIVFRSMAEEPWGSYRLVVGNVDVTYFDGIAVKIGGYQLTEPYGYGDASFEFPQITSLMIDQWGAGDLAWFDVGKQVKLIKVDADLNRVRLIWKGFIVAASPNGESTVVQCAGDLQGRLALRDKHPALFTWFRDLGRWLAMLVNGAGRHLSPFLGPDTGITIDLRGQSGKALSVTDWLLAMWQEADGDQGTVMPATSGNGYVAQLKDRTTVHYTAWNEAHGCKVVCTRDLSEEFTTVYGYGQDPEGQIWVNGRYPGLKQGEIPTFPGTLSPGDSGDDVLTLAWMLHGMNYLDRPDVSSDFGDAIEEAVEDLQGSSDLAVTGIVNSATWDALWNLDMPDDLTLRGSFQAPLVQLSAVRRWNYTSSGARKSLNAGYDPSRVPVDLTIDYGPGIYKRRARRNAKRLLNRAQSGDNWYGTMKLSAAVAQGDVTSADTLTAVSHLDIVPGKNIQAHNFNGTTLFHIASVDVDSDQQVELGIDTKARDTLTLMQMLERDQASKQNLARQWLREHRGTDANRGMVHFSEVGGRVFNEIDCPAGEWTVFPVIAGQSGSVEKVRFQTTDDPAEYVVCITAKKVGPSYFNHKIGDPFQVNENGESKWTNDSLQADIDAGRAVLGAWGTAELPCGYAPRRHTNDLGETTDAPITGLFVDQGGFDYHTFANPVVYVAIYPQTTTKLERQRVMWPVLEAGNN